MKRIIGRLALITFAILSVAGCGLVGPTLVEDGVVQFVPVEGGCWVIDTGERRLEPINLDQEHRVDGLRVSFEAEERRDLMSTCQIGTLVELTEITPIEG